MSRHRFCIYVSRVVTRAIKGSDPRPYTRSHGLVTLQSRRVVRVCYRSLTLGFCTWDMSIAMVLYLFTILLHLFMGVRGQEILYFN